MDVQAITGRIADVIPRLKWLIQQIDEITALVNSERPKSVLQIFGATKLIHQLCSAPPLDRQSFADPVWADQRNAISELVTTGLSYVENDQKCTGVVDPSADGAVAEVTRRELNTYGRSWFCWLNGKYREAQRRLKALLVVPPPRQLADRLAILDAVIARSHTKQKLDIDEKTGDVGRRAFGASWCGTSSDWPALSAINDWDEACRKAGLPSQFHAVVANIGDPAKIKSWSEKIVAELNAVLRELKAVFGTLKLDLATAFGQSDLRAIPLEQLCNRLEAWRAESEAISRWIHFRLRFERLRSEGMSELAVRLYSGQLAPSGALASLFLSYFAVVLREMYRRDPDLAQFDGATHEQVLTSFKKLDRERIDLARHEVALAHYLRLPRSDGMVGEVGIVNQEINKKRRHLPLRQLLKKAGRAIQAIKPVFMMSPISLAQFLEPGHLEFDLLLIDEASQVQPVDALGAVARAKQIVVVGDDRQLPPTRFFEKLLGDDEQSDDEEGAFAAGDVESILGLCAAQGISQRMLRWHYRSLHHSLVAVSNHEFYADGLFVVPSALEEAEQLGLKFRHIPEGTFDRGVSFTNRIEAKAVAQGVMEHARQCPELSLGVGAFSVAQRDAILDELELLRRQDPSLEEFFATGRFEPFFVKNLENIQGDERDVIFISVGYARDTSGYLSMGFGPLSTSGGERRLNVLITRARVRCEVFSSITADDIDLNRAHSRGAAAFKSFLAYARLRLLDVAKPSGGDCDSEFEQQVATALRKLGYEVDHQVGVAGFFVDLAVRDPEQPGRYLLGIECDGATYHSSRSARDRDRLRQQVLEGRQWIIHRIWSTDWFHRPDEQLRKTVQAIEAAKITISMRDGKPQCRDSSSTQSTPIQRTAETESARATENGRVVFYRQADFQVPDIIPLHQVPDRELAKIVTKVVAVEGPIHCDEIARRVGQLWGSRRTGSRMADAVNAALRYALSARQLVHEGPFYTMPDQAGVPVRNRQDVTSTTLRRPEMLPPAEIRAGLLMAVEAHVGVLPEDAMMLTARMLGFAATSGQLKEVIGGELQSLIAAGTLVERNGNLYMNIT
jgi:very-short-patch-repair endonuclease